MTGNSTKTRALDQPTCNAEEHPARRVTAWNTRSLEQAAGIFRALADAPRLRLLAILAAGPACVSELAEGERENLSTISQRLKVLHQERLVLRQRRGKHIEYALADEHVLALVQNALEHAAESRSSNETEP